MTKAEILELIDECRKRGVIQLKVGEVEFMLSPQLGGDGADIFDAITRPADPNKCAMCQNAPCDGKLAGHCRICSLKAAGAS